MGAGGLVTEIVGSCLNEWFVTFPKGVGRDDSSKTLVSLSSPGTTEPTELVEGASDNGSGMTFSCV